MIFISTLFAHEGSLTYEKFYRLNNPLYKNHSGDWLGLAFKTEGPRRPLDYFLMGDLRLYFQDNNSLNYSVQEGFVRYQANAYRLTVGRQILDWNQNEKYWGLGYLNANQAFTLLSDKEEGLMGIHLHEEINPFEFDFLFSYIFIPQVNPSIKIKNGVIESHSEWMRLPPTKTVINGTIVPIYYKMKPYKASKILLNKSLGANIKYKWEKGGASGFAIYKPENKVRINAEAYYDNISLNQVVVEADPTVNHHAYYGVQVYQLFGDVFARGGVSYVDPNARLGKDFPIEIRNARKTFTSDYFTINPRYEREAYSHFSANLDRKKYILSLNYIHILTKITRGNDDFFSDTVKWKRAIGGRVTYLFNDFFNILLDMKYDIARFDNIIKSEINYNYQNKIKIAVGLEMLKAPQDTSYWSYYRANDTIYSSLGFYF